MKIFREYSQGQGFLLPPSLCEFVPENHEARIFNDLVDTMDLFPLFAKSEGGGVPAYHPTVRFKLIIPRTEERYSLHLPVRPAIFRPDFRRICFSRPWKGGEQKGKNLNHRKLKLKDERRRL
jgi:hypothetical protein